jgi:uncharacterized protein
MRKLEDTPIILYPSPESFMQNDCDCACALDLSPQQKAQPLQGLWQTNKNISYLPLDEDCSKNWRAYYNPQGPVSLVVLNPPATRMLELFEKKQIIHDPDEIDQSAIQTLIHTGLLQPVADTNPNPLITAESRVLTAWLHLTDSCNLRCDYCYLPHHPVFMSLETAKQTVDKLLEMALRHGYPKLKLKYAGGEPLLKFDLLQSIHAYASDAASRHGIQLEEVILTNGTLLTKEKAAVIKSLGLRLMISLDGVGAPHDAHRKFANGASTFARVENAINESLVAGLDPLISITISGRNLAALPDTVAYLLNKNLRFAFNFYRENDCSQNTRDLGFTDDDAIQYLSQALQVVAAQFPERSLLGSLADRASFVAPHQHTCGAGLDYLVVHPSGRVAKCQMDMSNTITDIHAIDPLTVLRQDKTGLQNLSVHQKNECSTCQWQNYCGGGCPLVTFRATGHYDVRSPYCEIYKFLYPNLLKLEAQRLIFHANTKNSLSN